jgi:hypothetical protein
MARARLSRLRTTGTVAIALIVGCNLALGLDDFSKVERDDDGAGGTTAASTGGAGGSGGTGGAGGAPVECTDSVCFECDLEFCCAERAACAPGTDCAELPGCMALCDDEACVQNCLIQYPNGHQDACLFQRCLETNCNAVCSGPQYPICSVSESWEGGYGICLAINCCNEYVECYANPDCNECHISGEQTACDATTLDEAMEDCQASECSLAAVCPF